jgi:hypothetical protein
MPESETKADSLRDRLEAIERVTALFRAERFVYLAFAIVAFILLIVCIVLSLVRGDMAVSQVIEMGTTGAVAYTSGRVIVMWNRALSLAIPTSREEPK